MKKRILGFLAATFMLAAPCAHAGLDSWINNKKNKFNHLRHQTCLALSKSIPFPGKQPSAEHRHAFYTMLEATGYKLKSPIFLAQNDTLSSKGVTHTRRFGTLVEFKGGDDDIAHTLGHEISHVIYEDDRAHNIAVENKKISSAAAATTLFGTFYHGAYGKFHKGWGLATALSCLGYRYLKNQIPNISFEEQKLKEARAELIGHILRKDVLHDRKGLEAELNNLRKLEKEIGSNAIKDPLYPTLGEAISLIEVALNNDCTIEHVRAAMEK